MDYVFHDDIIPYMPEGFSPIKNDYFNDFFSPIDRGKPLIRL